VGSKRGEARLEGERTMAKLVIAQPRGGVEVKTAIKAGFKVEGK
jgi:hypothetical protein